MKGSRSINPEVKTKLTLKDARLALKSFARRIAARATRDSLALPVQPTAALRKILADVRKTGRADGSALLAGLCEAAMTQVAQVLAKELGLGLYRVDLASIVSKYIGETEKNLSQLFVAAEAAQGILFFDEADAIFGKRSDVKDAHDKYANLEVSYFLQRLESHQGLVLFAANHTGALDPAFLRRLRSVVEFPPPTTRCPR